MTMLSFVFMDLTQSRLGNEGYKNAIRAGILGIINSLSGLAVLFLFWKTEAEKKSYLILLLVAIALIMLICHIYNLAKIMKETPNDLVTIDLEIVRIRSGSFRGSPMIEGKTNDGKYHIFPLNRGDSHILKRMKKENVKKVILTYHSSSHRAVEIRW